MVALKLQKNTQQEILCGPKVQSQSPNDSACKCCEGPQIPELPEVRPTAAIDKIEADSSAPALQKNTQQELQDSDCPCCMEKRGASMYSSLADSPISAPVRASLARVICCQAPCCQPPGSVSFSQVLRSASTRLIRSVLRRSKPRASEISTCCKAPAIDEAVPEKHLDVANSPSAPLQTLFMTIGGMDCPACTPRVERALQKLDQVTDIKVDYVSGTASCLYDASTTTPDKITEHVSSLTGFVCRRRLGVNSQARTISLRFSPELVPAMSQLRQIFGTDAEDKENRVFEHQEDPAIVTFRMKSSVSPGSARAVPERFKEAGYPCEPIFVDEHELMRKQARDTVLRGVLRALISIAFLVPSLVLVWKPHILSSNPIARDSIVLAFSSVILFLASPIIIGAYKTLFIARHLDADVLISISTLSAYIYSVVIFALGPAINHDIGLDSFFETSSLLITLILISRIVSSTVRWFAVSSYLSHAFGNDVPNYAERVDPDRGHCIDRTHVSLLDAGDTILMPAGEVAPSDGTLIAGKAYFDESLITGEANPVSKVSGSTIVAGSRLLSSSTTESASQETRENTIRLKLTRAPHESSLVELQRVVSEARSSRPAIQDMADGLATFLIPCILVISALLLLIWTLVGVFVRGNTSGRAFSQALTYTIALLASSCPCALTLCVPLVYCVVVAKVAIRRGILVKDANAFIGASKVSDVVFDKTGTLTTGKLAVVDKTILPFHPALAHPISDVVPTSSVSSLFDPAQIEALVLALVLDDTHPVSSGVRSSLLSSSAIAEKAEPIQLEDKESIPGQGISARWNGNHAVKGGRLAFCIDTSADTTGLHPDVTRIISSGKTLFFLSIDSQVVAAYALQDSIKPQAESVVSKLRERGVRVSMLSGDNDDAAWEVGRALGFEREDVRGGCEPRVKRDIVRALVWKDECEQEVKEDIADNGSGQSIPDNSRTFLGRFNFFRSTFGDNRFVVFVGDGSNDAGVLSQANLGISFQSGTSLANAAADVILLSSQPSSHESTSPSDRASVDSDIQKVLTVLDLSGSTKRRIIVCFGWAVMYNFIAFILSSGVLVVWRLEPQWAGVGELISLLPVFLVAFAPRRG
ncbi:hypothetical protein HGRIS_004788 [Hohenbuehelia grisea]